MAARRRLIFIVTALLACATLPATAQGATYHVTTTGDDTNPCTSALPCLTVQRAIDEHRVAPDPSDVIQIGPGDFVGNFAADDDPADNGLTIRGTLSGGTPQTTLRGEGAGVPGLFGGVAALLGACGAVEVTLRDVNVDTVGADPDVYAVEAEGASDLINVHASTQPNSETDQVVSVCQFGTEIRNSTIDATGNTVEGAGIFGLEGFRLIDSHVKLDDDSGPGIVQFTFFGAKPRLIVRRSWIESGSANAWPGIITEGALILDSSLITGGEIGVVRDDSFGNRARWQIRNATIDVGTPGTYDVGMADLLLVAEDGDGPIEVSVANSILAEEIVSDFFGAPGPGSVTCTHSDVQLVALDPPITDGCVVGTDGNTTTPPGDQFVGGSPFDWSLLPSAPAVQAGTPGSIPNGFSVKDLAGNMRRAAPSAADCPTPIVDMGAYELVGVPCNTKVPQLKNGAAPVVGMQLGANPGQWTNGPTSFKNQWLRCDAAGDNCAEIMPYRTGRSGYRATADDEGHTLRIRYIAINAIGESDPAVSLPSGVVGP